MVLILFPLSISQEPTLLTQLIPGAIWIVALLANLLGVSHAFVSDFEDQHVELLLLSPIPLFVIILIRLIALWCATQLPLIILTPLFSILFELPWAITALLMITLLIGTPILTLVGALGAALTHSNKQQTMLIGVLMLPLAIPFLLFGVNLINQLQMSLPISAGLALFGALNLFCLLLLPFAIAFTLRTVVDT